MNRALLAGLALLTAAPAAARDSRPALRTVPDVDLSRYAGRWFEVAHVPSYFQRDCHDTNVEYTPREDGTFRVANRCRHGGFQEPMDEARGKLWVPDAADTGKLKVQFFWPFRADYWIVELDPEYRWAAVALPDRSLTWIIARELPMDGATYAALVERLRDLHGIDVSKLRQTPHRSPEGEPVRDVAQDLGGSLQGDAPAAADLAPKAG